MPLTDVQVRQARPKDKVYKLRDERGLLLMVRPTGAKWWRLRYKIQGKENMLSLGVYPDVSLSMARDRRDTARHLIADGKDPSAERQAEKNALTLANEATFEKVARHYLATLARKVRRGRGSIKTYKKAKWMLETFIFPKLGNTPIAQITASDLLVELKKIEAKGLNETARRTKQRCGKVLRHAIGLGHAVRDLTPDLRGLLEAPQVEHHAALTDPRHIGELLLDIDSYDGRFITRSAPRLEPLVFLRSFELRHLEWEHVDFEAAELRIPRTNMKGKRTYHIVPLAIQWSSQDLVETPPTSSIHRFKLFGAHAAKVTVTARAIVEGFDVFGDFPGRLVSVFIDSFLDSFFLETAEERLRHRVIPAVASAAHAGLQVIGLAEAAPRIASILRTLVRVNQRTARGSLATCSNRLPRPRAPRTSPGQDIGVGAPQ